MVNFLSFAGKPAASGLTFAKVVKSADETVTSSEVLQDDDELKFTPNVSKNYGYILNLLINSGTTPDFKGAFSLPTDATMDQQSNDFQKIAQDQDDATVALVNSGTGNAGSYQLTGRLIMDTTAGDVNFQWAQNVSNAGDTKVLKGSYLLVWEQ